MAAYIASMFGFHENKEQHPVRDLVWMHHTAKLRGIIKLLNEHQDAVMVSWFSDAIREFSEYFSKDNKMYPEIRLSRSISSSFTENKTVFMLEHYPIRKKEQDLFKFWHPKEIFVLSALDEPLFKKFNGEGIIKLMEESGMGEDEFIEHPFITKSIERIQETMEKQILFDNQANSAEEWFRKNVAG